jgi:hypothetical protein
MTGTIPTLLRAGALSVDRLRTVASIIADNEQLADYKPAAPHPLEGQRAGADAPTEEPPSGG